VQGQLHSMDPQERALALEVVSAAWERVSHESGSSILGTVRAEAAALPERHSDVDAEFAQHVGEAAVWYLDRATRRVGDPDRDGLTAAQRAVNLALFSSTADAEALERLFAMAAALNAEDA
jgi:hypothetical protein